MVVDTIGRDGTESTERDNVATNEEWAHVEEQQVVEQATSRIAELVHAREARRPPGGLPERPLRRRTERRANILRSGARVRHWQGDVADDWNVTIIELGDDRTADDESERKPNKSGRRSGLRSDRVDVRRRGRTCRRTSVTRNKFWTR